MLQLPESFLQEMRELLGDEYDAWEKSYEHNEGFRGLRVNTGKLRPEEFQALSAFSLRAVPWTRNGFYLEGQAQAEAFAEPLREAQRRIAQLYEVQKNRNKVVMSLGLAGGILLSLVLV